MPLAAFATLLSLWMLVPAASSTAPGARATVIAGVVWETSFESAKKRAAAERKPILLMHLFGNLDDALC